jgi:hypothetical protein
MRNAQLLRRIALGAALGGFVGVPVALAVSADPFGSIEVADPTLRPKPRFNDDATVLGVDGAGNALWATFARNAQGNEQFAVYERCDGAPVKWERTLLGTPVQNFEPGDLKVARDGTAMATWNVNNGGTITHYSSVRAPGGAWGSPQVIAADQSLTYIQFAISDTGIALAVWADASPVGTWASIRPAGGAWGAPEKVAETARDHAVAMSATGDAIVLLRDAYPGALKSSYRPAAGAWGALQTVMVNAYPDTLKALKVEFDGSGRAVALANFREFNDTIRVNVRSTGGTWGPTDQVLDDDGDNPPNPSFDIRGLHALVRHPQGAVAVWSRRSTSSNFNDDIVVSRLSAAGWESPQVFNLPNRFGNASVATNDGGEILLAGTLFSGPGDVSDIRATIAPSVTGAWPAMTLVSPLANTTNQYRDVIAGGGGSAFYLGWGVHGGSNERSEVISTKPAGVTCVVPTPTPTSAPSPTATPSATATPTSTPSPTPTATPTATATAATNPLPLTPTPTATPTPPAPSPPPTAIADFTTLPAASQCVRNRKLTVRLKRPPKGYTVKLVTVKVNAKRVATLKAKALTKPLYLRKLPRGTFTVTVSIKLTKGKGLTEKRRYTACK